MADAVEKAHFPPEVLKRSFQKPLPLHDIGGVLLALAIFDN
jgi:hypothetical protein